MSRPGLRARAYELAETYRNGNKRDAWEAVVTTRPTRRAVALALLMQGYLGPGERDDFATSCLIRSSTRV